jgi:hypothetical protein
VILRGNRCSFLSLFLSFLFFYFNLRRKAGFAIAQIGHRRTIQSYSPCFIITVRIFRVVLYQSISTGVSCVHPIQLFLQNNTSLILSLGTQIIVFAANEQFGEDQRCQ